jgi:hypothetical protein
MVAPSIVLLALLAQAVAATPDPNAKATAQALLNEGSRLYERSDYSGALEKFNAAYAAYPSPKLMFNIGQANRDLGRPVEALLAFENFLSNEIDASPETTADARRSLAELRAKLGRIRIECQTAETVVSIDGKSVGVTPLPEPLWATPGRHQVTASHVHRAIAIENVDVLVGRLHTVTLQLPSLADPVVVAPKVPPAAISPAATVAPAALTTVPELPNESSGVQPIYKKWWVWTGVGAVVVGGVATAFVLAHRSNDPCGGVGYACLEIK